MRYLHRVRHEDAETRFVSAADKLYNVRAVLRDLRYDGESAFTRFSAPKAKTLWYYRSLVREYRVGGVTHRLKPLHRRSGPRGNRSRASVGLTGFAHSSSSAHHQQA